MATASVCMCGSDGSFDSMGQGMFCDFDGTVMAEGVKHAVVTPMLIQAGHGEGSKEEDAEGGAHGSRLSSGAPGITRAVALPPDGRTRRSRSPWTTTVGAWIRRSAR